MAGLGIGLGLGLGPNGSSKPPLCAAIEAMRTVTADDGNDTLTLAPHIVYKRTRREIVTLDAVLIARNGQPVNRESLRTYRVDDLSNIVVMDNGFSVFADFDPGDPEYTGRTICVVQAV